MTGSGNFYFGSLDSLMSESGSSVTSSPNSLGSSFYLQRLNAITMERMHLSEKKLKGKNNLSRRDSTVISQDLI